jgi:hypothetical protein
MAGATDAAAAGSANMAASTQSAIGNFTALGGVLGRGIGLIFRASDAQLSLDKANL